MNDELNQLSDRDLDLVFEREVVGLASRPERPVIARRHGERNYCTDANNVLPWLDKWRAVDSDYRSVSISLVDSGYHCELRGIEPHPAYAKSATLARALATALVRAKRTENK